MFPRSPSRRPALTEQRTGRLSTQGPRCGTRGIRGVGCVAILHWKEWRGPWLREGAALPGLLRALRVLLPPHVIDAEGEAAPARAPCAGLGSEASWPANPATSATPPLKNRQRRQGPGGGVTFWILHPDHPAGPSLCPCVWRADGANQHPTHLHTMVLQREDWL